MSKVTIYFVCLFKGEHYGSTRMRSHDLIELVSPYLGPELQARQIVMPKRSHPIAQRIWARMAQRDSIYFFTKQAAKKLDQRAGEILGSRARAVCFDYVDGDPRDYPSELADIHICSSYAQEDALKRLQLSGQFAPGPTHVILHNASLGLMRLTSKPASFFTAAYIGAPEMTLIPDALKDDVAIVDASNVVSFERNLEHIPGFALHYCFRKSQEASEFVVKPFTKGVTASFCHANVITSRTVWDAEKLLGSDYPFLVDDNSEANILEAFDKAKSAFGTAVWRDGLQAMERLRNMVSGPSLARSVEGMARLAGVG